MKIYKITKVSSLQDIEVQAKDDKEIMQLYYEGVVDEILSTKNDHISYQIEDEDGNLIYGHIYT
jgi:DNA polymerase II small subunit/DNA polymerase delta subunit B